MVKQFKLLIETHAAATFQGGGVVGCVVPLRLDGGQPPPSAAAAQASRGSCPSSACWQRWKVELVAVAG